MNDSTPTSKDSLERFRQNIREEFGAKGIIPPKPNSPQEKELYNKWLEGQRRINNKDYVA